MPSPIGHSLAAMAAGWGMAGLMAAGRAYSISTGWDIFGPISRRYWLDNFWSINLGSIGRELVLLGPVAAGVWWVRSSRASARLTPSG